MYTKLEYFISMCEFADNKAQSEYFLSIIVCFMFSVVSDKT